MSGKSTEYTVGKGRPPKEYWYKKGESGNPNGRPRRPPNSESWKEMFVRLASEKISAVRNGRPIEISKWEAILERLFNEALVDDRARDLAFKFLPFVATDDNVTYSFVPENFMRI